MRAVNNIMVCLDLTEMDEILIRYVSFFSEKMKAHVENVYFVHNIRFDYPDEANEIIENLDRPLEELIHETITDKVKEHFDENASGTKTEVLVEEHHSTPHILAKLAKQNDIHLTITGKKNAYRGSGLVAEKLLGLNDFKTPLLLVPEIAHHSMQNLLVPTDFSKSSWRSLETGIFLQKELEAALSCVHVFSVPQHYFPYIPVEDMEASMRQDAEREWKKFDKELKKIDLHDVKCRFVPGGNKSTADAIYNHALRHSKDLIIISNKGRGALTSFIIGSVAIRLIQHDLHIPLMVTK
jgi:nucleotide-binding universal stress UspA family protein